MVSKWSPWSAGSVYLDKSPRMHINISHNTRKARFGPSHNWKKPHTPVAVHDLITPVYLTIYASLSMQPLVLFTFGTAFLCMKSHDASRGFLRDRRSRIYIDTVQVTWRVWAVYISVLSAFCCHSHGNNILDFTNISSLYPSNIALLTAPYQDPYIYSNPQETSHTCRHATRTLPSIPHLIYSSYIILCWF